MGFVLMALGVLWKFVRSGAADLYFRKDKSRLEERSAHRAISCRWRLCCQAMGGQVKGTAVCWGRGQRNRKDLGEQVDLATE